jgi:hypothetical protein
VRHKGILKVFSVLEMTWLFEMQRYCMSSRIYVIKIFKLKKMIIRAFHKSRQQNLTDHISFLQRPQRSIELLITYFISWKTSCTFFHDNVYINQFIESSSSSWYIKAHLSWPAHMKLKYNPPFFGFGWTRSKLKHFIRKEKQDPSLLAVKKFEINWISYSSLGTRSADGASARDFPSTKRPPERE